MTEGQEELEDTEREGEEGEHYEGPWWQFPPLRNALISGGFLALGFFPSLFDLWPEEVSITLYVLAALFGASHWGREAIEAALRLQVNIDVLMGVATIGAAVLGLWEEAGFLAFLYGAAEAVEELTYDRTRSAIRSLLDLAPKEARVRRNGDEIVVQAAELAPGEVFLVRPGESMATDGVILTGHTSINEAAVTGESVPVEKGPGDEVFAGTVNLTGALQIEVTRPFADNTLSRIIHLVEEAQEQKTNAQRFIDKFGDRYSPAVLAGALFLLVVPTLLGGDFREWAERAITLTVAGAPCALVMSTPVAVAAAIATAGRRGVLIKGGLYLESLGLLQTIAMDKTGTLTLGTPEVTDVIPLAQIDRESVLGIAASVERFSEHPLAGAIVRAAEAEGAPLQESRSFQALPGAGARAEMDGNEALVGNVALFQSRGARLNGAQALAEQYRAQGKTAVLVGSDVEALGLIAMRDQLRPAAKEAIAGLHGAGIRRIVMLTGDNQRTALAIASELGIDDVRADLKPEQKTAVIRELAETGARIAMVGDGINDAPALAAADVGIAMGVAGTDAAVEAADVALMADDLGAVVYAVRLGRRAQRISRQNIFFSLLLLAVLIPTSIAGVLTVALAVTAHEGAELIAVLNGLRARL